MKKYRNTESGKKSHRESSRNWYHNLKKNPERFSYYKITHNLRKRVREIIKRNQRKDFLSGPGSKLFGCTSQQLRKYLEKLFKPGMTWENYGKWHVDHIVPISKFNLKNPEERNKCFHYTNLQPLWAKENMMKGDKQYN